MNKTIFERATGIKRIYKACFYSLSGLHMAFRDEVSFRQELILAAALTGLCLVLPLEPWLQIVLIISHVIVLIIELLNTAVEAAVNKTFPEYHEDAKKAKDTGSAAVLLSLLLVSGLWFYALWTLIVS